MEDSFLYNMNITIFGAGGKIGNSLVRKALEAGHHVKAYVRTPSKLNFIHTNLQTIKGELYESELIKTVIKGSDVVISVMGPALKRNYEGMPLLAGHKNIVAAMKETGVKRFITLATPSVKFEKDVRSFATVFPGIMAKLFFPKPYKEIVAIGDLIKTSGLDWTIVRIIAPNDKPATGKVIVSFGDKKLKISISRADIAAFILKEAEQGHYFKSMPIIGG
jgi:putative NADH-flavin reductase